MERMIRSIEALVTSDLAPVASAEALFLAGEGLAVQEQIRLDVNARRVSGMSANSLPDAVTSSRRRAAR